MITISLGPLTPSLLWAVQVYMPASSLPTASMRTSSLVLQTPATPALRQATLAGGLESVLHLTITESPSLRDTLPAPPLRKFEDIRLLGYLYSTDTTGTSSSDQSDLELRVVKYQIQKLEMIIAVFNKLHFH